MRRFKFVAVDDDELVAIGVFSMKLFEPLGVSNLDWGARVLERIDGGSMGGRALYEGVVIVGAVGENAFGFGVVFSRNFCTKLK